MPEKIRTIGVESAPFIEVVKSEEDITIRYWDDHHHAIRFPALMARTLAETRVNIEKD